MCVWSLYFRFHLLLLKNWCSVASPGFVGLPKLDANVSMETRAFQPLADIFMYLACHEFSCGQLTVRKDLIQVFKIVLRQDGAYNIQCLANVEHPIGIRVQLFTSKFNVAYVGSTMLWNLVRLCTITPNGTGLNKTDKIQFFLPSPPLARTMGGCESYGQS